MAVSASFFHRDGVGRVIVEDGLVRLRQTTNANAALTIGCIVRVHGLSHRTDLNHKQGRIVSYNEAKERFAVEIRVNDVAESVLIKHANLALMKEPDGERVCAQECQSQWKARLNHGRRLLSSVSPMRPTAKQTALLKYLRSVSNVLLRMRGQI